MIMGTVHQSPQLNEPARHRLISGPLVTITVGREKRVWSLHRNLLCHHSPFLQEYLAASVRPGSSGSDSRKAPKLKDLKNNNNAEIKGGTNGESVLVNGTDIKQEHDVEDIKHLKDINIPNVDHNPKDGSNLSEVYDLKLDLLDHSPAAFELLVKWLYQGRIDDVSDVPTERKWDHAEACQKLYVLCERLRISQLKNIAIDQFRRGCNEANLVPGPEEMQPVYETTPPGSPFRKLVSQMAARQIMDPGSRRDAAVYKLCFKSSSDFAVDVINAIREGTGGQLLDDPTEKKGCAYHEHEEGQPCDVGKNGKSVLRVRG